jgi:hypothetical protein
MAVDLTTLEKYNQLSLEDKALLGSFSNEENAVTIEIADRQLALFEKVKNWTIAITVFLTLCLLAYSFGLPKSILGFIGGAFAFFFMGMMLGVLSYVLVEIVFLMFSKIFLEKTYRQKFRESVEKKWADLKSRERAALDEERNAKQRVEAEIERKYQKDFDAVVNFFSQDNRTSLMPKSLLEFSVNELADVAIRRTASVSQQEKIGDDRKTKVVSYYRYLSSLLHQVVDDEVVELDETKNRINVLMQDRNIDESLKSRLLEEYTRISASEPLKKSRDDQMSRKYFEKFEEAFPSQH